jgi:hypothetical protein
MYSENLLIGTRMHVNRSCHSLPHLSIAGGAVLLYAVLLVLGSSCNLVHGDLSQSHQHHHADESSSAADQFCAWACQATADTVAEAGPPLAVRDLDSEPAEFTSSELVFSTYASAIHSRAPPSISFVRLG